MKCDFCPSDFVRKETYRAHLVSHHKQNLTDEEFQDALDKIRKFQAPALDINQFTVEKQEGQINQEEHGEGEEEMEEAEMEELIEDEGMNEAEEGFEIYEGEEIVEQ